MFFDPRDIAPKCIFGYYSCYLQDRREFKPTRVVYFFTRNTMVLFILLYLEKRGCYSRFYRIFSLKSDKKLPFDPKLTSKRAYREVKPVQKCFLHSNSTFHQVWRGSDLYSWSYGRIYAQKWVKMLKMSLNIQKPKIGPLWRPKGKIQNSKNEKIRSEIYWHDSFYFLPKFGREV